MQKVFLYAVFVLLSGFSLGQTNSIGCEPEPYFPGGKEQLFRYFRENLKFPESAGDSIRGKCYVEFVVKADGSIANVKVVKSIANCPACDAEAVRVVRAMPRWKPAVVNGKPVNASLTLPFTFSSE